jgi:prephenate dehydratase
MEIFYLGPPKTFSEKAAAMLAAKLCPDAELVPMANFQQIAQKSSTETRTAMGVLPYYNFLEGLIQESLDLVVEYDLFIRSACRVPVEFSLGGATGQVVSEAVYSHPKALAQCSDFLKDRVPNAIIRSVSSTAEAARLVRESGEGLAIASRDALQEHGLHILAENIGNRRHGRNNFTDFLLLVSRSAGTIRPEGESFRTMMAITPRAERVGLLAEILAQFAFYSLNIAKIHSRPAIDPVDVEIEPQMFYVELMSRPDNENLRLCAQSLDYRYGSGTVRQLGFFPALS